MLTGANATIRAPAMYSGTSGPRTFDTTMFIVGSITLVVKSSDATAGSRS